MDTKQYTPADYKSDQPVRWCPGCGDHAILNVLHKAMAEIGVAPHMTAVISGIGCSSRLPYYMNTYGLIVMMWSFSTPCSLSHPAYRVDNKNDLPQRLTPVTIFIIPLCLREMSFRRYRGLCIIIMPIVKYCVLSHKKTSQR